MGFTSFEKYTVGNQYHTKYKTNTQKRANAPFKIHEARGKMC